MRALVGSSARLGHTTIQSTINSYLYDYMAHAEENEMGLLACRIVLGDMRVLKEKYPKFTAWWSKQVGDGAVAVSWGQEVKAADQQLSSLMASILDGGNQPAGALLAGPAGAQKEGDHDED